MNTHDIELPPLPPGYKSYEFPDGGYDEDEMRTYALAAIEADRKQRSNTKPSTNQDWLSLDPAVAFHLIERHAENWNDAGAMMQAYLDAHIEADRKRRGEPVGESQRVYLHDEGSPEYLDGAQCQYVIERGQPYPHGDTVAFVYEKEDAERIVAALNDPCRDEPVAWPKTAAEIRDFIDVHYISMAGDDDPSDDDKYTLTAHDLLTAFRWWTGFAPQPAEPVIRNSRNTAEPVKVLSKDEIRAIMLKHGYTIKPGYDDLKPYVYAAARELIALAQGRNL